MLTFASPTCRSLVAARVAPSQQAALDSIAFLEFNDVKESTVQDVEFLRDHPLIIKVSCCLFFLPSKARLT
jgi:hypothetical protein